MGEVIDLLRGRSNDRAVISEVMPAATKMPIINPLHDVFFIGRSDGLQ